MLEVRVITEIQSSAKEVWDVLACIAGFESWNPVIRRASGELRVGDTITIHVANDAGEQPIDVVVTRVIAQKEFGWKFMEHSRWLYRGEHVFTLEDVGGGLTQLVDSEYFWGLLVPFRRRALKKRITASMTLMGSALKKRIETQDS